jgi:hypothetical protein
MRTENYNRIARFILFASSREKLSNYKRLTQCDIQHEWSMYTEKQKNFSLVESEVTECPYSFTRPFISLIV